MSIEPLAGLDSVFVTMDSPNAPLHVGMLLEMEPSPGDIIEPRQRFERIQTTIHERLAHLSVLRRRVLRVPFDLGPPVLVDDPEFDISFHVVRRAVPAPGGSRELDDLVARIMARPLAPDRPLWEISVIEGLAKGRTALLAKVHHALADGVAGVTVFAELFDLGPERRSIPTMPPFETPPALPSPLELLAKSSSEILRRPGAFLEALGSSLERLAGKVDEMVGVASPEESHDGISLGSLFDAPTTPLSGTVSYARRFERFNLDLPAVKTVARRHGATVTDFAMTMLGGALRHMLELRDELPEKDLVAFVPVNLRPAGTEGDLGNQVSGRLAALCSSIEDPFERLEAVAAIGRQVRQSEEAPSDLLNEVADIAGPALASMAGHVINAFDLFEHVPSVANVILSSVPGPPIPLWCAGEKMVRASPIGPLMFNQSLNVTVLGYGDSLEFGILACARKVPDVEFLKMFMEEEGIRLLGASGDHPEEIPKAQ